MDLYHKLNNNIDFLNQFCDILETLISEKKYCPSEQKRSIVIDFKKNDNSIFFFIDGSSILQISPDKELQYTYATAPSFQDEINKAIKIIKKQYLREEKINKILTK